MTCTMCHKRLTDEEIVAEMCSRCGEWLFDADVRDAEDARR